LVEQNNRFKKHHFFKSLEQNDRFKKCTQGGNPKKIFARGESQRNFLQSKAKLVYFAGDKDVFTLKTINAIKYYNTFIIES
jgi:hypothetical protein